MKVLFIGGTGVISSACSGLAISQGIELFHLNRGLSASKRHVEGVKNMLADIRKPEEVLKKLEGHHFDAVVDWISFVPGHIQTGIDLFSGKTDQFIFISSASAYQTPPEKLPVTEETPLDNPYWQYSKDKIACEDLLQQTFKTNGFPITIVRPSHTYDKTLIPLPGRYTVLDRMKKGIPVIVHGDGTSIWTLTHHEDFAVGLVGLLGNPDAIGEAFHITSDEWLTWNQIYRLFAKELGVEAKLVHIPSEIIATYDPDIGAGLLGDKAHSMIFDNAKIKGMLPEFQARIPFSQGVREIVGWYEATADRQIVDDGVNALMDRILSDFDQD